MIAASLSFTSILLLANISTARIKRYHLNTRARLNKCKHDLILTSGMELFNYRQLEMITKEVLQQFLSENNIELKSTHKTLCFPVINRIYKKMKAGIKFAEIKVSEGVICDGHHRYLASLMADYPIGTVPYITTSATDITEWESVDLVDDDWDTPAKIQMLNEQDADFNAISLEKIVELLK